MTDTVFFIHTASLWRFLKQCLIKQLSAVFNIWSMLV